MPALVRPLRLNPLIRSQRQPSCGPEENRCEHEVKQKVIREQRTVDSHESVLSWILCLAISTNTTVPSIPIEHNPLMKIRRKTNAAVAHGLSEILSLDAGEEVVVMFISVDVLRIGSVDDSMVKSSVI